MRTSALAAIALCALLAVPLAGCGNRAAAPSLPSQPPATAAPGAGAPEPTATAIAPAPSGSPVATSAPTGPESSAPLSAKAKAYAKRIGGASRKGETLYFIIGKSTRTQVEAQAALDAAIPSFGDLQSYFIVQKSANFEGMQPGWWIVAEAYRSKTHAAEQIVFAQRAFPDAYVSHAKVLTSDPIPIYEDAVGLK